jgi:hypothetical protein
MKIALSALSVCLVLALFALIPAFAQEGPDENESNDTMRTADSIDGFTIDGEVGRHNDDEDWYVLEGQEGTNPYFTLTFDDDECDIDMDVYSDEDLVGSLTGTTSPDSDSFDVPGTCYLRVYSYDGHGEYSIDIEAGSSDTYGDECGGDDEVEPNGEVDLADTISGDTIEGYACDGDEDWFYVESVDGTRPEITLRYDDGECDIDLDVYDDDELVGSLTSTDSPDSDEFRVRGDLYIRVYSYDGEGDYTVEID